MSGDDACTPHELVAADGARATFCRHGAHLLSWRPVDGDERLWLSRVAGCGPGTAIRGGIPVIWPQFAERGDGPRHGMARDRAWTLVPASPVPAPVNASPVASSPTSEPWPEDGRAGARLQLSADHHTRARWPYEFTLTLDVAVGGDELDVRLTAHNDGDEPFAFTAALHTYLRVSSTRTARVDGLAGGVAEANDGGGPVDLGPDPLLVTGPIDVAVREVDPDIGAGMGHEVTLRDPVLGDLVVVAEGFDSRVVWNPGPGGAPSDVHPGGESEFVCVEPALLTPRTLEPREAWTGRQVLRTAGRRPAR